MAVGGGGRKTAQILAVTDNFGGFQTSLGGFAEKSRVWSVITLHPAAKTKIAGFRHCVRAKNNLFLMIGWFTAKIGGFLAENRPKSGWFDENNSGNTGQDRTPSPSD